MSFFRKLLEVVHGEHQHRRVGSEDSDLPRSLKPIHDGHLEIQDHYIRAQFLDLLNRCLAVLGFPTYSPRGVRLDVGPDKMAYKRAIVDDENRV